MMRYRRVHGALIATALTCAMAVNPVSAEPDNSLENLQEEQDSLENQKLDAQSELNDLQDQLETLLAKRRKLRMT